MNRERDSLQPAPQRPPATERGPAQTPPTPIKDQWRLEKIYPDPLAILLPQPSIEELLADCIYVFDTSALLAPYESGQSTITEIGRVLRPIATQKRLFVPQRAIREFANNRGPMITAAASRLLKLKDEPLSAPPTPFLGNARAEEALRAARDRLMAEIRSYYATLDSMISEIRQLNHDDPISSLYRDLFPATQIIKSDKTREALEEDFARRVESKIPPGYEDKHIGDLVIWHSILDHAEKVQKNTIFVSNDIKEDWAHKIGEKELGRMVAARYELVYEYGQRTKGRHYAQLQLAELLKYLDASDTVVAAVEASQRAALATRARRRRRGRRGRGRGHSERKEHLVRALRGINNAAELLAEDAPVLGDVNSHLVSCFREMEVGKVGEISVRPLLYGLIRALAKWQESASEYPSEDRESLYEEWRAIIAAVKKRIEEIHTRLYVSK